MLNHIGTKSIDTKRLLLRKFTKDDSEHMFKNWANDDVVTKYLTWPTHKNIEVTNKVLENFISEYEYKNNYHWVMELKEIGQVIGSIGVVNLNEENYSCEVGYCISKTYWSKGIATEALKSIVDYLFSEVGFNRIVGKYEVENLASGRVMAKSGMKYEGTFREVILRNNNEFYDMSQYAILKSDWKKSLK